MADGINVHESDPPAEMMSEIQSQMDTGDLWSGFNTRCESGLIRYLMIPGFICLIWQFVVFFFCAYVLYSSALITKPHSTIVIYFCDYMLCFLKGFPTVC